MLYVRIHNISQKQTILTDTDTGYSKRMTDEAAIDLFLSRPDIYGMEFVDDRNKGGYFKIKGKQKEIEQKYKTDANFRYNCSPDIFKLKLVDSVKEKQNQIKQQKQVAAMKQTLQEMNNITSGLSFLDDNSPAEKTSIGYDRTQQVNNIKNTINAMNTNVDMQNLENLQNQNNQRMSRMMANNMAAKRVLYQGQQALNKLVR